jgi:toxin FitB
MVVVDSSGWLEYFSDGANAEVFAPAIEAYKALLVPTISMAEVFKRTRQQRGRSLAYRAMGQMKLGRVVDLDYKLAVTAARISLKEKLPLADSIILATAREYGATLWTQDAHFEGIAGVRFYAKK